MFPIAELNFWINGLSKYYAIDREGKGDPMLTFSEMRGEVTEKAYLIMFMYVIATIDTRFGLQCRTPLRSYPLSLDP